jgi:hypothetical protein
LLAFALLVPPAAAATPSSRTRVAGHQRIQDASVGIPRAMHFGAAQPGDAAALLSSPDGFKVSPADEQLLTELYPRGQFADAVDRQLLPYLQTLPTFGGAYFDRQQAGVLDVALTEADDATEAAIKARAPASGTVASIVVRHTLAELRQGLTLVRTLWPVYSTEHIYQVAVDEQRNAIVVGTSDSDTIRMASVASDLTAATGIPIILQHAESAALESCTRETCFSPMRPASSSPMPRRCNTRLHARWGSAFAIRPRATSSL